MTVILTFCIVAWGGSAYLLIHLLVMVLTTIAGIWLFADQHRFEATEWTRQAQWTAIRASLSGSSYLKLPALLQWFTGNIGFHHVHHLLPRVPNYRLQDCHDVLEGRQTDIQTLSFGAALRAPSYALWDEAGQQMVPVPA